MCDLAGELNDMANNIEAVLRWQELFNYTYDEALQKLRAQRLFDVASITDDEWERVREEQQAIGHDRVSYEHSVELRQLSVKKTSRRRDTNATFLFILQKPLDSAETIRSTFDLASMPTTLDGTGNDGEPIEFCRISFHTRRQILERYSKIQERDFILDNYAPKNLSDCSRYPTLGIDTTMPQYRLTKCTACPCPPLQNQYPVWYFFYGTLGDPDRLSRLLHLADMPEYHKALVRGGKLTTWANEYMALIDSSCEDMVDGLAYEVNCQDDEMRLQYYETNKYDVVRVEIELDLDGVKRKVPGLTFRYVG